MFCFLNTGILFPNLLTDLFMLKFKHKQNLSAALNHFLPKILIVILLTVWHTIFDVSSENLVLDQLLISH